MGRRQRGGEGREEREQIHVQQRGLNGWVARHGRGPPRAAPQDGGETGRVHQTEPRQMAKQCCCACMQGGGNQAEQSTAKKEEKKRKQMRTTPRSTRRRRDREGRVASATRRPQVTRTARETAQERGAGAGGERPVLGAQKGPRMEEHPVGPRHRVAGGPVGYKNERRDGMGPHDNPGE